MKKEIYTYGMKLSEGLENDITSIISNHSLECSPHMKLFWEQQKKHFAANPKGRRYHPQFVAFCLSLHAKSSSAYKELQDVLVLPSERTLINYKNVFKPKPGIHKIHQLQVSCYSGCQRFVGVTFDEMKIKSSLDFDKHSEEIVEFTDLGHPALTFSPFEDEQPVATTVIAFLIRCLMTSLKFVPCYFLTSALQLLSRSSVCFGKLCQFWSSKWTFGLLQLQQMVVPQTENSSSTQRSSGSFPYWSHLLHN